MNESLIVRAVSTVLHRLTIGLTMYSRTRLVKHINEYRFSSRLAFRQDLYDRYMKNDRSSWVPKIKIEDGYAVDLQKQMPYLSEALRDSSEVLCADRSVNKNPRKLFLNNLLNDDDFYKYKSFLNLATSTDMLSIVADYLGFIPVLSEFHLWQSDSGQTEEAKSSQLYHLDNADSAQVKIFIHLDDVDEASGPFTFIGAKDSNLVRSKTNYGQIRNVERLTDEQVYAIIPKNKSISCTFSKGDIAYVDTINCFHFGSRCTEKRRNVLMIQYLSPCRADFRIKGFSKFIQETDSEIRKAVLDPTVSY